MAVKTIASNPRMSDLATMIPSVVFSRPQEGVELALQLVKPLWHSGGQGFPLVVFIQGSGFTKPDQFYQIPQLCQLARKGYVVASVTHRNCFDTPAPAYLQDGKTAVRFLRAHAQEYDIDKARVCIWGTSSGGNTALMMGLTGDDAAFETQEWAGESSAVQAVVDCFGPVDLASRYDMYSNQADSLRRQRYLALGGGDPAHVRSNLSRISPVNYVQPGRKLPPFLMLNGDADKSVPYADSERIYNLLQANGYEAELVRVMGAPHEGSFWSQELLEIIFDFIEKSV